MIRILQCVNNMHRAGLETLLMNYYRNIDRTKIQFDFLMHRQERSDYDDEIESLGGRIFRAPRLYPQNYPAYFAFMKTFFREHPEYRIVHSHIDSMSYLPLLAAKKAGVPVRIAHSHSTAIDLDLKYPLKQYFRYKLNSVATHRVACGENAGHFLFRNHDFTLIPNAIDAAKFSFSPEIRVEKRKELDLGDAFAVGHAGRFTYAKNHTFLLKIFQEILNTEPNAVLLLAGTGEKEQEIRNLAEKMNIAQQVKFLGSRGDMHELYQAMDVFVMPSLFEGIPVVGVEAQCASLPCVFSDQVPKGTEITDLCRFVSLKTEPSQWAGLVLQWAKGKTRAESTVLAEYDIRNARHRLEDFYTQLDGQVGKVTETVV